MNLNEACTAVSEEMPIITVILNNQVLGMVYQWQTAFYGRRYSSTTPERKTDFVKVIEGFGGKGFHVDTEEGFKEAFKQALFEKIEDEYDVAVADEAYQDYLKSGKKSRPVGDLWKDLGI